jgi:Putative Flp pilus-assembly TadE/G-like
MILVALAMIAIIAMAALSIDVITLYLAKLEAQRAADTAAVAAARVISLSGLTGDPTNQSLNWALICGPDDGTNGLATRIAKATAAQNTVGGIAATTVTVTYAAGNGTSIGSGVSNCSSLAANTAFGVNPIVNVQLTRTALPNFFSRIWGNAGTNINASASAEAFNPSNSGNVGNQTTGPLTPVQPRCVKPWIVPNLDPRNPDGCTDSSSCAKFVDLADGSIQHPGISLNGGPSPNNGVIGETFWLVADCRHNESSCTLRLKNGSFGSQLQPQANLNNGSAFIQPPPNLMYVPSQVTTSVIAIPSCTSGDPYEEAIEGCDQPTNYSCGVPNANVADLRQNPTSPTSAGVQCLIHQGNQSDITSPTGQDYFNAFGAPASYPFQIYAGSSNPLVTSGSPPLPSGTPITTSPSIVSLPIYDNIAANNLVPSVTNNVTFVGFLQVFINAADNNGNVNVTVLNVAGCGNGSSPVGASVSGNSPVPVRLITPP